jgi:3alpha(or 20beta)-hydroxysteroid dehydrogenase
MRLQGKTALITGAASGIGYAIAELFAKEGATVFASDIVSPATPYPRGVEAVKLDVTSEEDWVTAADAVVEKSGRLDVLVNNAGIIAHEPLHELEMEDWQRMIAVDQTGVAKGAVRNMSKNAAMTYVADSIRVNSVHPGFIHTPLTDAQAPELNEVVIAATPMKRGGTALEVAYGCLYLACDESSYVTGIELVIDGGYLAQ